MNEWIEDSEEDRVWQNCNPDELWVMDKLILARKLGYKSGPVGLDVSQPGWYCVRPCVNMMGLGLGTQKVYIEKSTMDLPVGHFWCEWFEGRHLSVDYNYGEQVLCVEGFKSKDTFTKWDRWTRVEDDIPLASELKQFAYKEWLNVEYIGDKVIEVHFRYNEDFDYAGEEFIPVWEGQSKEPPDGYHYVDYPDVHGRIGAFVK